MQTNRRMLIDGKLVDAATGATMEVRSPADGSSLGEVPRAGSQDVDLAVRAARQALDGWRGADLLTRRAAVLKIADVIREHTETLGHLDAVDSGNPVRAMRSDVNLAALFIDYLAGLAFSSGGSSIPTVGPAVDFTLREPYGVTARIIPYNHPILFAAWKIAAPLLTGNTVVLKLPDQTPLSGLHLAERLADIFPPGVINVITGTGAEAGDALVRHPGVDRIAFIGSVPTGRRILQAAAERIVPVTLELGGKNPMIVCDDVDIEAAMAAAVKGMNFSWSQGQSCGSYSRLFIHESRYDEAVPILVDMVRALRLRHPLDEEADMGSLVSPEAQEKVRSYVESAVAEGAQVATGGRPPSDPSLAGGCYFEPTVLTGVDQTMRVAREEIFGPVLSVLVWSDVEEVIRAANATEYGLTANVWTNDIRKAFGIARRIESGSVAINGDGSQHWIGVPFGGFKQSGLGKEESAEELLATTREKNIYVNLAPLA